MVTCEMLAASTSNVDRREIDRYDYENANYDNMVLTLDLSNWPMFFQRCENVKDM